MYDVVIVGARCAGAPLARFLARAGKRVLVVDAAALPKDQPLSTHFIHPFGMRILDELELGDRVREIAPPIHTFRTGIDDHIVKVEFPQGQGGCCPRRFDLDQVLLDGARDAGAEVRVKCRVVDLVRDGERVVGVIVDEDGARSELRASVVVGADGRHSTIAELAGAEEYLANDAPRCAYWAYFPRPAWYTDDARYEGGTLVHYDADDFRVAFPTNRDQMMVGYYFPNAKLDAFKTDPDANLVAAMRANPYFAPLVEAPPLGKTIGFTKGRFFVRRAAGPGWALVGDAGLFKDPSPGLGITDAFRDAKALAAAIIDGSADTEGSIDAARADIEGAADIAGRDAAGRDAAGRDAGRDAAGRDAAGRDAAGRDAAGRDAAGRDAAGLDAGRDDDAGRTARLDVALVRYWRARDVESWPLFYFARDLGALDYNNAFNRLAFERLCKEPKLCSRLVDVVERRCSPYEAFGFGTVMRWTFGAMLRGRFDVLKPFFKAGQVGARVAKELKEREKLLASV